MQRTGAPQMSGSQSFVSVAHFRTLNILSTPEGLKCSTWHQISHKNSRQSQQCKMTPMSKTPFTTGSAPHPGSAAYVRSLQPRKDTVFTLLWPAAFLSTCPPHRHSAPDAARSHRGPSAPWQLQDVSCVHQQAAANCERHVLHILQSGVANKYLHLINFHNGIV